jgi:hypothetical protein
LLAPASNGEVWFSNRKMIQRIPTNGVIQPQQSVLFPERVLPASISAMVWTGKSMLFAGTGYQLPITLFRVLESGKFAMTTNGSIEKSVIDPLAGEGMVLASDGKGKALLFNESIDTSKDVHNKRVQVLAIKPR